MRNFNLLLLFFISSLNCWSQALPRQGNWGIFAVHLADSIKQEAGLDEGGVFIKWIKPGTTGSELGVKVGDLLYQINDQPISSPDDIYFSGMLNQLKAGDDITYHVYRENKKIKCTGKVLPKPLETNQFGEVIYDKVPFKNGHLSTIITKPNAHKEKVPAVYFIPGYNCASYDNIISFHPYQRIIDSLTHLGYAVFRTEKSGMGDSYNTPNCYDIDFYTEQEGFEAGYEQLLTYDFIDTSRIFVFGHSLGGIHAPLLAEKYNPKGVIVYGTTHLPWMEYLTHMLRFQNIRLGVPPIQVEKEAKIYQSLLYDHYVLDLDPEALIAKDSAYLPLLQRDFQYIGGDMIFQRHYTFMQQLNDINLTASWAAIKSHVLSIYGESDFEAINSDSHESIVRIVNHYHPGNATFLLVPETNHSFIKVGSMMEGVEARNNGSIRNLLKNHFNYDIITEIDNWIKSLDE